MATLQGPCQVTERAPTLSRAPAFQGTAACLVVTLDKILHFPMAPCPLMESRGRGRSVERIRKRTDGLETRREKCGILRVPPPTLAGRLEKAQLLSVFHSLGEKYLKASSWAPGGQRGKGGTRLLSLWPLLPALPLKTQSTLEGTRTRQNRKHL